MKAGDFRNRCVRSCSWLFVVLAVSACQTGPGEEITSTRPYADLVGAKYVVTADNLYAYGVYESIEDKQISYVELVPMRIGGSEFAFRRTVPKGKVIRVLSAWKTFRLFESGVYYLVAVEDWDLPPGVPVRLQLSRGNEDVGANLNPAIYRRLPKDID